MHATMLITKTRNQYSTGLVLLVLLKQRVSGRKFSDDSYSLGLHCLLLLKTILEMLCYNYEKYIANQLFEQICATSDRIHVIEKTWSLIINVLILARFSKVIHLYLFSKLSSTFLVFISISIHFLSNFRCLAI